MLYNFNFFFSNLNLHQKKLVSPRETLLVQKLTDIVNV